MPRSHPAAPCPVCARAQAFVARELGIGPGPEPDVDDFIATLASVLDSALGHLLRDFDYAAHPDTHTASAARLVALCAHQLHRLDPHAAQRERLVQLLHTAHTRTPRPRTVRSDRAARESRTSAARARGRGGRWRWSRRGRAFTRLRPDEIHATSSSSSL